MDNNPIKTTSENKAMMIIGGQGSGKTVLVKQMMNKFYINEVAYCIASSMKLDEGILPAVLFTGYFPKKMIVVEGITSFVHVLAIVLNVRELYEKKNAPLPQVVFTCQDERWLGMHKVPRKLSMDTIEVVRLDNENGERRSIR